MDERARQEIAATAAVHAELGQAYDGAVAEGLVERISLEIDKHVDARLAQRGMPPSRAVWANVAMGLGSVGLGIGATTVILRSWPASGVTPKAVVDLGSFHASLMTSTNSVSIAQVVLIALIWAAIAVINIVYARRHPHRA
jgi:hypothetical protein